MKKIEIKKLKNDAEMYKGRRSTRYIDDSDIEIMKKLDRKKSLSNKNIRVYSSDGFVPSSYKYPADIDYIERTYENGEKIFSIRQTSAQRHNGNGPLIVVNNRRYEL